MPPPLTILTSSMLSPALQRDGRFLLIRRGGARGLVRHDLLAVQPDLDGVVAAEREGERHGAVGVDGAVQVEGGVLAVELIDFAVRPFRVRGPLQLAVGKSA